MSERKASPRADQLSRRERQIMDVLYRLQRATAAEVLEALDDPPSDSAVRTHLRILEEKGYVYHEEEGRRFVFLPRASRERERTRALSHLMTTFFDDSRETLLSALLGQSRAPMSDEEAKRLMALIAQAKDRPS
ncbi:MAG: BlaI/MecI/CopY family transcriptional regulator [Gemmatimonadaceae bacterium]|nr:BlaI/MecI/CopY family transcriptional regulator [Gemmatimonadaceae bacterium]